MSDQTPPSHRWGFIGAGRMATALARGMLRVKAASESDSSASDAIVVDPPTSWTTFTRGLASDQSLRTPGVGETLLRWAMDGKVAATQIKPTTSTGLAYRAPEEERLGSLLINALIGPTGKEPSGPSKLPQKESRKKSDFGNWVKDQIPVAIND